MQMVTNSPTWLSPLLGVALSLSLSFSLYCTVRGTMPFRCPYIFLWLDSQHFNFFFIFRNVNVEDDDHHGRSHQIHRYTRMHLTRFLSFISIQLSFQTLYFRFNEWQIRSNVTVKWFRHRPQMNWNEKFLTGHFAGKMAILYTFEFDPLFASGLMNQSGLRQLM